LGLVNLLQDWVMVEKIAENIARHLKKLKKTEGRVQKRPARRKGATA